MVGLATARLSPHRVDSRLLALQFLLAAFAEQKGLYVYTLVLGCAPRFLHGTCRHGADAFAELDFCR